MKAQSVHNALVATALFSVAVQLAACAPTQSYQKEKEVTPADEVRMARSGCQLDAEHSTPTNEDGEARAARVSKLTKLCMEKQGFVLRDDPSE